MRLRTPLRWSGETRQAVRPPSAPPSVRFCTVLFGSVLYRSVRSRSVRFGSVRRYPSVFCPVFAFSPGTTLIITVFRGAHVQRHQACEGTVSALLPNGWGLRQDVTQPPQCAGRSESSRRFQFVRKLPYNEYAADWRVPTRLDYVLHHYTRFSRCSNDVDLFFLVSWNKKACR